MTYVNVKIRGKRASDEAKLLVDTGSTFTWIPRPLLERIGVKPTSVRTFRTIEGREVKRQIGEAVMEFKGEHATRVVVFAEKGDASVLGADSLEGLGFEVDPITKRLKKVEAFIAY